MDEIDEDNTADGCWIVGAGVGAGVGFILYGLGVNSNVSFGVFLLVTIATVFILAHYITKNEEKKKNLPKKEGV